MIIRHHDPPAPPAQKDGRMHETCFSARGAAGGQHQSGLRKRDTRHQAQEAHTPAMNVHVATEKVAG